MASPRSIMARTRFLQLDRGSTARLPLQMNLQPGKLAVVIDLYAADNPTHPDGHLGWWRFPPPDGPTAELTLIRAGEQLEANLSGVRADQFWRNPEVGPGTFDLWHVHLLLYHENTAIHEEGLCLATDGKGARRVSAVRDAIEGNLAELAVLPDPPFCWPANRQVHIVAPDVRLGDGVGNFAVSLYRLLRAKKVPCALHARNFDPEFLVIFRSLYELEPSSADLVIYQFSTHDPCLERIADLPCRKIAFYQNVTPAHFFSNGSGPHDDCQKAYAQLPLLVKFDGVLANSRRSAADLAAHLGPLPRIGICPPLLEPRRWEFMPAEEIALPHEGTLLLCIGRLSPHKRVEDVLVLFAAYHRLDPGASLLVVGRGGEEDRNRLAPFLEALPTDTRGRVHFLGHVSDGQLKAIYQRGAALVTMSEHEGYCVPLVEAMSFGLPIFAFAEPAVRETLGGAGRLFAHKDYSVIAQEIAAALHHPETARAMAQASRARFSEIAESIDAVPLWQAFQEALSADACAA